MKPRRPRLTSDPRFDAAVRRDVDAIDRNLEAQKATEEACKR